MGSPPVEKETEWVDYPLPEHGPEWWAMAEKFMAENPELMPSNWLKKNGVKTQSTTQGANAK